MEGIVFFGKGGVGKSTVASNVSAVLARGGRKVLHAGCDPKMDSTLALMGRHIPPFGERTGGAAGEAALRASIFPAKIAGVHCIEAGGPQPGVGCAGLGIGSMLDAMKDGELLVRDGYDAAVFDVLGDVVCGGFAAPLRRGFAKKVVVVTSETLLSLYAANRLIQMIENYSRNGVYLAGLAVNAIRPEGVAAAENFARAVNTRVLGVTLRDQAVAAAEREHRPAVLASPRSDFSARLVRLTAAIRAAGKPASAPRPMVEAEFFAFMEGRSPAKIRKISRPAAGAARPAGVTPAEAAEASGFTPAGLEGGQLIFDWRSSRGAFKTVFSGNAAARGPHKFSDWAVCFHPSAGRESEELGRELEAASAKLAGFTFRELRALLGGDGEVYSPSDVPAPPGKARQHLGAGAWSKFIFYGSEVDALAPPDAVMAMHGDGECRFCICEGGALGAFSENGCVKAAGADLPGPVLPRSDEREPSTDFLASEAVFGDEGKILNSLRTAAAQAGPGGLVEFYVGCSPMMLASDAAAFAEKVGAETGAKVWLDKYCTLGKHSAPKAALRSDFMARKFRAAARRPERDVNLVYYGSCPPELLRLLNERGIAAGEPGESFYSETRRARLQVLSAPDGVLSEAYDQAGLAWSLPPAPYGFSGTSAWLSAIAVALGRRSPKSAPSSAQSAAARALRAKASGLAAGFVLPAGDADRLSGAAFKRVPVLRVLAEGGWTLKFFVLAEGRLDKREAAAIRAAVPAGAKCEIKTFSDPVALPRLLRAEKALRLVYSDVRADGRVAASGLTSFSAGIFEPGYEGALETWRRLLELGEWDFNERYLP